MHWDFSISLFVSLAKLATKLFQFSSPRFFFFFFQPWMSQPSTMVSRGCRRSSQDTPAILRGYQRSVRCLCGTEKPQNSKETELSEFRCLNTLNVTNKQNNITINAEHCDPKPWQLFFTHVAYPLTSVVMVLVLCVERGVNSLCGKIAQSGVFLSSSLWRW